MVYTGSLQLVTGAKQESDHADSAAVGATLGFFTNGCIGLTASAVGRAR